MKRILIASLCLVCISVRSLADEGMWLPQLLQALNEKNMKKLGLKINAEDIYSINKSSLKDAIVSLGGFCTAEVISSQGLILTNHHCGFDAIQNHSSIQNNLIQNGFWAYSKDQELENKGLFVSFIEKIEEVTSIVLAGVTRDLAEKERQSRIDKNLAQLRQNYKKEIYEDLIIRPFFDGNKYYLFITKTFRDVRLVGAPPAAIGNFGKDTDNWMWPRHTGDFSLFRIYADKNNNPAAYSADNKPYVPKRSLKISLAGMKEGDFTMVFGFPGRTNEYLTAAAVKQIMTVNDPAKIGIRAKALEVLNGFMRQDEKIRIQYAAKYASIENAYKKWQGEVLGLNATNAIQKKLDRQLIFQQRVDAKPEWKMKYGNLLPELEKAYFKFEPYGYARDYFNEVMPRLELMTIAGELNNLKKSYEKDSASYDKNRNETLERLAEIFKEYDRNVDRKMFESLAELYFKQNERFNSPLVTSSFATSNTNWAATATDLYGTTKLVSADSIRVILTKPAAEAWATINDDPAMKLYLDFTSTYSSTVSAVLSESQATINRLQREYMQAQMDVFPETNFYPDANSTLRLTYGNVKGYKPRDAVAYNYYTYLDGVLEKYKPGDYEFDVPKKLRDLYAAKDYGEYGVNGKQPVCFTASNHTTGGNSGSPALDGYGNLVGLNFDRVWEGTMSDINYDARICRNIMVDIRYVLFIIDKYAGAKNLIAELELVRNRK